jgi:F-type H+-transporting ATPase subunit a
MWTLVNNLMGLVPGLGSSTDNMNTTLAMGIFVFLFYNYEGIKAHGFRYVEHFTGHLGGVLLLLLGPMMFVIEVISHLARPMTLGIRLRSNIFGDHTVGRMFGDLFSQLTHFLGVHLGVTGTAFGTLLQAVAPVPLVMLGMLVCVIQAFIFLLLTIIYVGIAVAHDEH